MGKIYSLFLCLKYIFFSVFLVIVLDYIFEVCNWYSFVFIIIFEFNEKYCIYGEIYSIVLLG